MQPIAEDTHDHEVGEVVTSSKEVHAKPAYEDLNTPMIALIGFVSAFLIFACIFALQAAYLQFAYNVDQAKVVDVRYQETESMLDAQRAKLNTNYQWADREAQTIIMPIEQAMRVVVEEYQAQ